MSISSCATERLKDAATTQGQVRAPIALPVYPDDCRKKEPHADVAVGAELRSVLIRERAALDRQNARMGRCAAFFDDVKSRYADGR
ncbi:hypothetical protein HJB56_05190 [Rhizobium lentis]|nr:hypothetical protein [Rhizobium lentis]MBX5094890.1 hypothetical protein [Rhizobium lentis]MBX5119615.1 hypothetical protein [Rhizobium lentis]